MLPVGFVEYTIFPQKRYQIAIKRHFQILTWWKAKRTKDELNDLTGTGSGRKSSRKDKGTREEQMEMMSTSVAQANAIAIAVTAVAQGHIFIQGHSLNFICCNNHQVFGNEN